jgi:hypothetical protein
MRLIPVLWDGAKNVPRRVACRIVVRLGNSQQLVGAVENTEEDDHEAE